MTVDAEIRVVLSRDEALVLFDCITRINDRSRPDLFESQAEQRVFWNLEAALEKLLVEPFAPNYRALVAAARARLADSDE